MVYVMCIQLLTQGGNFIITWLAQSSGNPTSGNFSHLVGSKSQVKIGAQVVVVTLWGKLLSWFTKESLEGEPKKHQPLLLFRESLCWERWASFLTDSNIEVGMDGLLYSPVGKTSRNESSAQEKLVGDKENSVWKMALTCHGLKTPSNKTNGSTRTQQYFCTNKIHRLKPTSEMATEVALRFTAQLGRHLPNMLLLR